MEAAQHTPGRPGGAGQAVHLVNVSTQVSLWQRVLGLGAPKEYRAGQVLFRARSEPMSVFLIVRGFVNLTVTDPEDGVERSVYWRTTGQLCGAESVVLGEASSWTAKTATPCLLHVIPAGRFRNAVCPESAGIPGHQAQALSREITELMRTLILSATTQARRRLEWVLWRLSTQQATTSGRGEVRLAEFSPGNRELAGYIGVNPTYIPSLFASLNKEGLARRLRGGVIVTEPRRLFRPAGDSNIPVPLPVPYRAAAGFGPPRRVDAGYTLYEEGESAEDVYFLEQGFVELLKSDSSGQEVPVLWCHAGQLVGEQAALLRCSQPLTAKTRTRCLLSHVPAASFRAILNSQAASVLVRDQSAEALALCNDVMIARNEPVRRRLEHVLWQLAAQQFKALPTHSVRLTEWSPKNADLAGYIGSEERYVSDLIQDLKAERILCRGAGRTLVLWQPHRLYHTRAQGVPGVRPAPMELEAATETG